MSTSEFPAFRPAETPALAAPPSPTAFDVPKHKSRPSGRKRGPRRSLKKVPPVVKKPRGRPRKAIADKHAVDVSTVLSLGESLKIVDQIRELLRGLSPASAAAILSVVR